MSTPFATIQATRPGDATRAAEAVPTGTGKPVPHWCEDCKAKSGSYYGRVVFANEKAVPQCPYHKTPLTRGIPRTV